MRGNRQPPAGRFSVCVKARASSPKSNPPKGYRTISVYMVGSQSYGYHYLMSLLKNENGLQVLDEEHSHCNGQRLDGAGTVFIVDVTRPREGDLREVLEPLHRSFPKARVMALGEPRQLTELCELIRQGADGFLPYSDVSKHLLPAIRTLAEGGLWIHSEVLAHYVALSRSAVALPVEHKLTARETEVVGLAAQHLSNKEISARLSISEGVVKYHCQTPAGSWA